VQKSQDSAQNGIAMIPVSWTKSMPNILTKQLPVNYASTGKATTKKHEATTTSPQEASRPTHSSDVCSLTGNWVSRNYFTYRQVQIFEIIVRIFLLSKI